nr:core protein C [Norway rat hepacivirus 2]
MSSSIKSVPKPRNGTVSGRLPVRPGRRLRAYVVNVRKSSERGSRPPRRKRRDLGYRYPTVAKGARAINGVTRDAMQFLLPSAAYPPGDPRNKSRFLGHIIDGTLGWTTDLVHHVPIVGSILGHPCRWLCRGIRALEDGVNMVTSPAGVYLFLLCCLTLMAPAAEA